MRTGRIRNLIIVLLGIVFLSPLAGEQTRAAPTAHHSVWKVEGKRSTVYLVGSVHVLKEENYPLPVEMDAAFTNSAIAAFETDIEGIEGPEMQMKLLAKARLPEGETLPQQLSPEIYTAYTNRLKQVGLPVVVFNLFKPSMAAIALTLVELQRLGFDPQFGLDKHFFTRARKEGKQIVALETLDFQIGLATDFSKEEGELLMRTTLEDLDNLNHEFPELLKAWQTGDADKLEQILNKISEKAPRIFKRLVTDRNQQWLPKIAEWLQGDQNAVMIVGAGHLVGKQGVVELLRTKGLKVTQL